MGLINPLTGMANVKPGMDHGMTIFTLITLVVALTASFVEGQSYPKKAVYLGIGLLVVVVLLSAERETIESERAAQRAQEVADCRASAQRTGIFTNPVTGKSVPIMTCPRE